MKALKLLKALFGSVSLFFLVSMVHTASAQEYDDMYFNKSDRKTVKVESATAATIDNNSSTYKEISETTETYSAKNINPEYIARYKSSESNEASEQAKRSATGYTSDDYFVEDYNASNYVSDSNRSNIDYRALALRDEMSYSNYNRTNSNPNWRFSPYVGMGMGMGYGGFGYPRYGYPYSMYDPFMRGYNPYMMGYDPFMMVYGSGMTMGLGMGFGYGMSPAMSYNIGMSWGTGGYPGFYNPFGYNPWGSMYSYGPYGCPPYYTSRGFIPSNVVAASVAGSEYRNGRNMHYKARNVRANADVTRNRTSSEQVRRTASSSRIRVPSRDVATVSNGRTSSSRDYSRAQNPIYTNNRNSTSSSVQRISSRSTSGNGRSSYFRSSDASRSSAMYNNRPSRTSSTYTSGSNRSSYSGRSSYTNSNSMRRSTSGTSYSNSSRSSFSNGSSGYRSSSFSSGGSRSGGSSYSGARSSGGGGSSSGGRSSGGRR